MSDWTDEARAFLEQRAEALEACAREYGHAPTEAGFIRAALGEIERLTEIREYAERTHEEMRAEVERLSHDRGMLKAVHGALVDAGCRMGEIGHCEADLVREVTRERDEARAKVEHLRVALEQAANSLETIAEAAGSRDDADGLLRDMSQVRGYARSRSVVARAALRGQWTCTRCGYMNGGGICTHCAALRGGGE